ncbi:hypothetical protein [Streptomyces collinus]|uniref:hypothetical protein n=1 Tax=Streptomyces collinus TaxID=42684 RepID=UPI002942B615|nr:hypothetical protein [Streptomyces collinus]
MTAPVDELDPVRAELLRAARAAADATLDQARADAADTLLAARTAAETVLARARRLGEADGAKEAGRERVRAAQDAWEAELAVRAEVYAALRAGVRASVRRALAREGAMARSHLADVARAALGPQAVVRAAAQGGVTAEVPGRRVDLSADALADAAVDRLGVRAETLWGPP